MVWRRAPRSMFLVVLFALVGCGEARYAFGPAEQAPERRVAQRLAAVCDQQGWPGATAAFVTADGRLGKAAAGVSRKSTGTPMRPDDRMFSGSIGKTYVSAVALKLVEEGRLDLDTLLAHWFGDEPWFDRLPNARDVTVRMLLNHTSGIPEYYENAALLDTFKADPYRTWTPLERVGYVLDAEPLFPAGEGWTYADTNYIVAGMVIEEVTGDPYYAQLKKRILRPYGLDDTIPADRPALPGLISGYTSADNIFGLPEEVAADGRMAANPQMEWTGGGLVSTAPDLARWAWLLYGGQVLADREFRELLDGVPVAEGDDTRYGLGVFVQPSAHGEIYGHSGWMVGYVSVMAYYPEHGIAVAVQVNTDVDMRGAMLYGLLDEFVTEIVRDVDD